MSHSANRTQTRHNVFLFLFFCDGRRNESTTHLTLSFLLSPSSHLFSLVSFFFLCFFQQTCRSSAKARRQWRVLGGGNDCILGWWFFSTTSDEVGKGGAQIDITQRKQRTHIRALVSFFLLHVFLLALSFWLRWYFLSLMTCPVFLFFWLRWFLFSRSAAEDLPLFFCFYFSTFLAPDTSCRLDVIPF
jgi:hypothetical protein